MGPGPPGTGGEAVATRGSGRPRDRPDLVAVAIAVGVAADGQVEEHQQQADQDQHATDGDGVEGLDPVPDRRGRGDAVRLVEEAAPQVGHPDGDAAEQQGEGVTTPTLFLELGASKSFVAQ